MGLLDDAIRDHLELKRRSGADPGDVARLEREAFGQPAEQAAAPAAAAQAAADHEHAPATPDHEVVHEADVKPVEAADGESVKAAPDARVQQPPREPVAESDPGVHVAADALDEPAADSGEGDVEQPTRQFTAAELDDAERPPAPPPGSENEGEPEDEEEVHDELEETPDFLQETPEHDRLWFEQKPPRDFDF